VPAGLPELIRQERQQRLATAQAQVAYDAEVAALKLGKLQAYFESTLAEHVVAVHPFAEGAEAAAGALQHHGGGRSRSASTIRPPELPREVQVCDCFGCVCPDSMATLAGAGAGLKAVCCQRGCTSLQCWIYC
jgi:hypothetical protein